MPRADPTSAPGLPCSQEPEALLTADFVLVCSSSLLFFLSMFVLLPALPPYIVQELGGTEAHVGLIMGAFAGASILSRPSSGRLVEVRSRKSGLVLGALIYGIAPLFYTFATTVPVMLALRFCHGAGIAFFTTASSVLVADLAPPSRRGEAMGYFGMMMNFAMAIGPYLGGSVVAEAGFSSLFFVSSGLGFMSLLLLPFLREPLRPAQDASSSVGAPLFSKEAVLPGCVAACMSMTLGSLIAFLPLFVLERALGNPGLYFIVFSAVVIVTRPIAGKWSDRYGRSVVIVPGMLFLALAMIVLSQAHTISWLVCAAVIQGIGFGGVQPALLALGADRATDQTRGPVLATLMMALDLGHTISGIGLGLVLHHTSFSVMYLCVSGLALLGSAIFLVGTRKTPP